MKTRKSLRHGFLDDSSVCFFAVVISAMEAGAARPRPELLLSLKKVRRGRLIILILMKVPPSFQIHSSIKGWSQAESCKRLFTVRYLIGSQECS